MDKLIGFALKLVSGGIIFRCDCADSFALEPNSDSLKNNFLTFRVF